MELETVLITLAITMLGILIGHSLTMARDDRRAKSVEKGLYYEAGLIARYYTRWIKNINSLMQDGDFKRILSPPSFDLRFIDLCVFELISLNKPLNQDQRELIENLRTKLLRMNEVISERESLFQELQVGPDTIRKSRAIEAELIGESLDLILGLEVFCQNESRFRLSMLTPDRDKYFSLIERLTGNRTNHIAKLAAQHFDSFTN